MAEIKLKRCPSCGGEIIKIEKERMGMGGCELYAKAVCKNCGLSTKKFLIWDKEDILKVYEAWNTRKPMDRIVSRLEEELELSERDKRRCIADKNSLQFDEIKGYANGIYNAIEFVKEEYDICSEN